MRIDELQQLVILESPLHGHGTDAPPAAVQAACGLLDGVALRIRGTGITVVQQNLTQVQHRRHTCAVLLDVSLQLLDEQHKRGFIRSKRINSTGLFLNASCVFVPAADQFPLDLLVVAGVVDDGTGQFGLNVGEPRAQTIHVLIQLLNGH